MHRIKTTPRANWQAEGGGGGLTYHTPEGQTYWDESAHYELTSGEVDKFEKAGNDVYELCLKAAQHVIDNNLYERLAIPAEAAPLIEASWNRDDLSLYGRFDFAWSGF